MTDNEGVTFGLSQKHVCELLQISERRIQRWRLLAEEKQWN